MVQGICSMPMACRTRKHIPGQRESNIIKINRGPRHQAFERMILEYAHKDSSNPDTSMGKHRRTERKDAQHESDGMGRCLLYFGCANFFGVCSE